MLAVEDAVARRKDKGLLLEQRRQPIQGDGPPEAAQNDDAALHAGHVDGLLEGLAAPAAYRFQGQVGAATVGDGLHRLPEGFTLRRQNVVGTKLFRQFALLSVPGGNQNPAGAQRPGGGDSRQADVAGPQHHHGFTALHQAAAHTVHRHGERLDEGAFLPRHAFRQRVAADGAPLHVFGESAALVLRLPEALAELPLPAVPALRTRQPVTDRFDCHPPPDQAVLHPAANLDNLARHLVAEGNGIGLRLVGVHEQVGAADAGGADAHDDILGAGLGSGGVGQHHGIVAVEESGFHIGHGVFLPWFVESAKQSRQGSQGCARYAPGGVFASRGPACCVGLPLP